ncbi:type IV toxin-antitoxin system AbiEi family antitoxin domain-containing protein [Deinococcus aestuarii]|nr:type IV toxin-antitoxin system AbiEi family antitoxin domain-containing protein [Deinococcus aestuarii]
MAGEGAEPVLELFAHHGGYLTSRDAARAGVPGVTLT